jgi:hypothetical protein
MNVSNCQQANALIQRALWNTIWIGPDKRHYCQLIISDDKPTSAGSETPQRQL